MHADPKSKWGAKVSRLSDEAKAPDRSSAKSNDVSDLDSGDKAVGEEGAKGNATSQPTKSQYLKDILTNPTARGTFEAARSFVSALRHKESGNSLER